MVNVKEEVVLNLRSMIISKKDGIDLCDINTDYKEIFGIDVPLKTLNCDSLEQFFQNNPENFILNGAKVKAVIRATSEHIVSMIKKQRSKKKKNKNKNKNWAKTVQKLKNISSEEYNASTPKPKKKKRKTIHYNDNYCQDNWYQNYLLGNKNVTPNDSTQNNFLPIECNNFFYSKTFYEDLLIRLCLNKRFILPTYSITSKETYYGSKKYYCNIFIGNNFLITTYPSICFNEIEAKELASKKALLHFYSINNFKKYCSNGMYVNKLEEECYYKNLPHPLFTSFKCHQKQNNNFFISEIHIGNDFFYSSYPIEAPDEYYARDMAAKKALEDLNSTFEFDMSRTECFF